jgi:hypothetical protein
MACYLSLGVTWREVERDGKQQGEEKMSNSRQSHFSPRTLQKETKGSRMGSSQCPADRIIGMSHWHLTPSALLRLARRAHFSWGDCSAARLS